MGLYVLALKFAEGALAQSTAHLGINTRYITRAVQNIHEGVFVLNTLDLPDVTNGNKLRRLTRGRWVVRRGRSPMRAGGAPAGGPGTSCAQGTNQNVLGRGASPGGLQSLWEGPDGQHMAPSYGSGQPVGGQLAGHRPPAGQSGRARLWEVRVGLVVHGLCGQALGRVGTPVGTVAGLRAGQQAASSTDGAAPAAAGMLPASRPDAPAVPAVPVRGA